MLRAILALFLLSAPAFAGDRFVMASGAEKKVWRIDSLIATLNNGVITVRAKGAVQTGGWHNVRLKLIRSDARGAVFAFVGAEPAPGMTVIEAVVPVSATIQLKSRVASVRVMAQNNEITSQVLR